MPSCSLASFCLLTLCLITSIANAQSVSLPTTWVNSEEWQHTTTNTITFPATGSGGSWMCGTTGHGPYTANSVNSLEQAVIDAESCRTANGSGTLIVIPSGSVFSGQQSLIQHASATLVLPQSPGDNSTNFIVFTSNSPLTTGQTACSHGVQDNLAESTQIGLRNLGCNSQSLSYQLGTTVTTLSGSFTLANGINTSASAYNDIASMWTLECTGGSCNGITTEAPDSNNVAPHHYAILNVEVRPKAGLASPDAPIRIGSLSETQLSQLPTHIHFLYDYLHGDWTDAPVSGGVATGPPTGANSLPNDIAFDGCVYCSLSYSYVDRSLRPGAEGHGMSFLLAQQLKLVHNWVEGESIGQLCGGFASSIGFTNFVTCQDVEDRGNRYTYPYSWLLANNAGFKANGGTNSYVRKNAHEYKFSQRVVLDGNIFENVDNSGAQNGIAASAKTAQTSGGSFGTNYWTIQTDTTLTNNIFRSSCNGVHLGDRSADSGGNGGGVSLPAQNYLYQNNLVYNVTTNNPGCAGSTPGHGFRIGTTTPGTIWSVSAQRDSRGATVTLTLIGSNSTGNGVSDFNIGDPVTVYDPNGTCTDPTFETGLTNLGPPALTGTLTDGLTVVYANTGTPNATAQNCTLANGPGGPNNLAFNHNSEFVQNFIGSNDPYNSESTAATDPYGLSRNISFTNSIFVGGGINSQSGEGTRTETRAYNAATEIVNNDLFPGRDSLVTCPAHKNAGSGGIAACYTEYTSTHQAITPVTLYGVPTAYCTGSDPTANPSCVGILGAMSQTSFPAVLNDWHEYRLCHTTDAACSDKASIYSAGQQDQASDGTDLGFNPTPIDSAETSTRYCNGSVCGFTD